MRRHTSKAQQLDLFSGSAEVSQEKQAGQQPAISKQWNPHGDLIEKFLESRRSPVTRLSYRGALRDFFGGYPREAELRAFLGLDEAQLCQRMKDYQDHLLSRRLSPSTVNHRLTTLRSLLKFAHSKGLSRTNGQKVLCGMPPISTLVFEGALDAEALKRLVRAPGTTSLRGLRDTAILRLLTSCALHRSQLCMLDVADYKVKRQVLVVRAKAPTPGTSTKQAATSRAAAGELVAVPLSFAVAQALDAYLEAQVAAVRQSTTLQGSRQEGRRANVAQPLFCNLDRRSRGAVERLTVDGIYYLVNHYGQQIGLPDLNSRHLRRTAITAALRAVSGDEQKAQERLPHVSLETLQRHKNRAGR